VLALHPLLPSYVVDVQVGEDGGQLQFGGLPPGGGLDVNGSHLEVSAEVYQFAQVAVAQGLGGSVHFGRLRIPRQRL
jgi:hypothetical protein